MIICVEGITNSGKSSLCKLIESKRKLTVVNSLQRSSVVSQQIKKITKPINNIGKFDINTELLLYSTLLSDKARIIESINGDVIIDRFALSVFSYFIGRYSMDYSVVRSMVNYSSRNIIPDVTFFLDVSLEVIKDRAKESPFTRKDIGLENYYNKLRNTYLSSLNDFSQKSFIIDCNSISELEVYRYVCRCMEWT